MADESPATKQDLQDLRAAMERDKQDLRAAIEQDKQDLRAAIEQDKQDLKAAIEKVETTLLSEFWKWASTNDIKIRSLTGRSNDLDERLQLIEQRVFELERRRQAS
jgi:hypothetical protein